ncbi:hypothetical protein BK748_13960 [Bacillus thuringiensis serovar graciosensis]|nr:hypothetical protein BK748_13960 [Bacillus thuringiensis serovar graciosensis]
MKALRSLHILRLPLITVDKNPAYHSIVITGLNKKMLLGIPISQIKYLNNIVEQNQKRIRSMRGPKSFPTVTSILTGSGAKNRLIDRISLFKIKNNSFISYLD